MCTILIADDELTTVKNIFNSIIKNEKNIKLIGISSNGKETLEIMQKNIPDILLLDLMMPEMNGLELLDILIEQKDKYLTKTRVIVISSYIDKLYKTDKYRKYIYGILPKPYNSLELLKLIERVKIENNNENIKKYIEETLKEFNFNKNSSSYKYLKDAIYQIIYEEKINFDLENDIYRKVAKKNNKKNGLVIKWGIEKLMNNMYMDTKYNIVNEYFNFIEDKKPTTKLFIRYVVNNFEKINKKGDETYG